jgi:hypothetical protein
MLHGRTPSGVRFVFRAVSARISPAAVLVAAGQTGACR